jgi:hypothetical protein
VNVASRRVVHHSITTMVAGDEGGDSGGAAGADDDGGSFIVEYASGKAPEIYPENSGVLLKAGSKLRLGLHLHSVGEDVNAEIEAGFLLYPKGEVPKYIRYSTHHGDPAPDPDDAAHQAGEDHRVPAAHAYSRQIPVPRADLSVESQQGDEARDDQLRELELQLASGLQLRR